MDLVDYSEPCRCCGGKKFITETDYRDGRGSRFSAPATTAGARAAGQS